ncbi:MAG: cobalamin B12-binding domain-containing protein [Dehalobacterium sp.]
MSKEQIIQEAIESILKIDNAKALKLAEQTLAEGLDSVEVLTKGFSVGIKQVGDLFGRGEMFLPELMLAAGVMQRVTKIFDDAMQGQTSEKIGKNGFCNC